MYLDRVLHFHVERKFNYSTPQIVFYFLLDTVETTATSVTADLISPLEGESALK